tara:strand:- start:279 stop:773 length:495 start_codon:yes stop_codon:yes gene_type:complete
MKITKSQLVKIIQEEIATLSEIDVGRLVAKHDAMVKPGMQAKWDDEAEKILSKPSALGDKKYAGTLKFIEQVLEVAPPEVKAYMAKGRNGSVIKRAIARLVHDVARGEKRWYEEVITHTFEDMKNQKHFEAIGQDALFAWDEAVSDELNWEDLLDLSGFGAAGE